MERKSFLCRILAANGIVDLGCAAILLVLPLLRIPVLGYQVFDSQGAYMAGGWGVATLALGLGRLLASSRPASHPVMLAMGLIEGTVLALFSLLHVAFAGVPLMQASPPLAVGVVFGVLYTVSAIIKR
jgi:hypothetical protein